MSSPTTSTAEPAKASPAPRPEPQKKHESKPLPPYHVVLLDDDDHTYAYVMEMVKALFAFGDERCFRLAEEVDLKGRAILLTTHKERAELKREQVRAFGRDIRVAACSGSMSAIIEPAEPG